MQTCADGFVNNGVSPPANSVACPKTGQTKTSSGNCASHTCSASTQLDEETCCTRTCASFNCHTEVQKPYKLNTASNTVCHTDADCTSKCCDSIALTCSNFGTALGGSTHATGCVNARVYKLNANSVSGTFDDSTCCVDRNCAND